MSPEEVVVCYDADAAGQKATERALPLLRKAGVRVRVLSIRTHPAHPARVIRYRTQPFGRAPPIVNVFRANGRGYWLRDNQLHY